MSLTYELGLCDDGNILSNKEKLLKIGKLLGVEAKTCKDIPNNGCNMADSKMEGRQLILSKQIFKTFQIKLLTSYVQITQIYTKIMMYKEQRFISHSK